MVVKIGINGFGRIGRAICREVFARQNDFVNYDSTIAGINSLEEPKYLAYLLKHDTIHGKFKGAINYTENSLIINGQNIPVFAFRNPSEIPWKLIGVEYVCECTGFFTTSQAAEAHINRDNGADYVVISAPPKDDTKMFVMSVNEKNYQGEKIVSCASCTTNCLAPLINIVHEKYGVKEALMTTVHSTTSTQLTVDGTSRGGKDWRGGRAASGNIIPASTGAAKAVGKVVPDLNGKITGMALRVPTLNVSVVDVTCSLEKSVSREDLFAFIKEISENEYYKRFIGWTEEPVVSSDMISEKRSSVVDLTASICLNDNFIKLVSWYDNETGYSNRMVDLVMHMSKTNNQ